MAETSDDICQPFLTTCTIQQTCCCEPAGVAAAGRRQLNGTSAQRCVGAFSKLCGPTDGDLFPILK